MAATQVTTVGKARWNTDDLTSAAQAVFSNGRWVTGVTIRGGAAAEVVILRASADTPPYMEIPVGIAGHAKVEYPWFAEAGLEALTATAAGDVNITITYL